MTSAAAQPDWVSPPGETIEDLLEERGWSQAELALRTGFSRKHVNELVQGRVQITSDCALKLESVLGAPAKFWIQRESQYREALARQESREKLLDEADWLKDLPLPFMKKQGWITAITDKADLVTACRRFFGVASHQAYRDTYEAPLAAFRASEKFSKKAGAVAAWIRQAERQAEAITCKPYDEKAFRALLVSLRGLTTEPNMSVAISKLVEACAEVGVAVVVVPTPPGCPASGATRWLSPKKAMLVLSLRHGTADHLWFTFFHEVAHLLLHGRKMVFLEGMDGLDPDHEEEANRFSKDLLIPPSAAKRLRGLSTAMAVQVFAAEIGVAPGIVVGRMQHEKMIPWSKMNDMKVSCVK